MVTTKTKEEKPLAKPWLDPPARSQVLQRILFSSIVPFLLAFCIAVITAWEVRKARAQLNDVGRQRQELLGQNQVLQDQLAKARADLQGLTRELGEATTARDDALKKLDVTNKQVTALEARESYLATILSARGTAMEIYSVVAEHKDGTERERAVALVERGKKEVTNSNIDLATWFFDRAAQEDPTYAGPYIELSKLVFPKNQAEAEKLLLNADEVEPSSPWPSADLLDYYLWKKDLSAAKVWAEKLRAMKNLPDGENSPRKVLERYDNKIGNRPDAGSP
jgi:hypothetical protein